MKQNFTILQLGNHLVALLEPCDGVVDKLVDNSLGGLLLVADSSGLAHEEGAELVQRIVDIDLGRVVVAAAAATLTVTARVHQLLKIGLVRDNTLCGELLDLLLTLRLPVLNVWVLAYTQGATGEDEGLDVVVVAGSADGLLVGVGGTGLVSKNEAGSDPDGAGAHHQGSGQQLTVVNAAGGDDLNGAASDGALVTLAEVDNSGNEDGSGGRLRCDHHPHHPERR